MFLLDAVVLILIQALATLALCYWVIDTTLLAEITNLAHKWQIGSQKWYPLLEQEQAKFQLYTKSDWIKWAEMVPMPYLLTHMLSCQKCFSFHASLWASLFLFRLYPTWETWLVGLGAAAGLATMIYQISTRPPVSR